MTNISWRKWMQQERVGYWTRKSINLSGRSKRLLVGINHREEEDDKSEKKIPLLPQCVFKSLNYEHLSLLPPKTVASGVSLRGAAQALTVNQSVVFPFSAWQLCLFLPGLCLLFILVLSGKIQDRIPVKILLLSHISMCDTVVTEGRLYFSFIKISHRNWKCFSNISFADHQPGLRLKHCAFDHKSKHSWPSRAETTLNCHHFLYFTLCQKLSTRLGWGLTCFIYLCCTAETALTSPGRDC